MKMESTKRLRTIDEIADFLHVSPATVRRAVKKDGLPVIRIGKVVRFDVDAVRQALAEKSCIATATATYEEKD